MTEEKHTLEKDDIVEGEVTNVVHFGAFVRLESGEEGLIHISEIANEYISNIDEFITMGQKVKVKILARNNKNKLELSLKQVGEDDTVVKTPKIKVKRKADHSFEDQLSVFMKRSEEKQIDVRRNLKNKQGVPKKRR